MHSRKRFPVHGLGGIVAGVALAGAAESTPTGGTPPRLYQGKCLEAVAMPLGGIGTGSIWLDGQGRLAVWQIFNNLDESRVPDSFLAIHARPPDGKPLTRVLQTVTEAGLAPMASLTFEGGYPIARLRFAEPAFPVEVRLEALNPMVPLDAAASSIPGVLFRVTTVNPGPAAVTVSVAATLRNARGDRNRVVRDGNMVAVAMEKAEDPVLSGPIGVQPALAAAGAGPELFWIEPTTPGLVGAVLAPMRRALDRGGVIVAGGVRPEFLAAARALRQDRGQETQATVFEDFEKDAYEGWQITGNAFGNGPARGTLGGQQEVSGFAGHGLVNTYIAGDGPQGTATSRAFTIKQRYIGLLVGGGNYPNLFAPGAPGSALTVFEDFDKGSYEGWEITGDAFGKAPAAGTLAGQQQVSGFSGRGLVNTFAAGDGPQGTATSKAFRIEAKYISFLLGGGEHAGETCVNLVVDGKVVHSATGRNSERLDWCSWDVTDQRGKQAVIEIVDRSSAGWGHVNVDQIVFAEGTPAETCVNLVVDGKVVRSVSGQNREELEPVVWDVADLAGRPAVIEIVDRNSGHWGHVNVDQIVMADVSPELLLRQSTDAGTVANALAFDFAAATSAALPQGSEASLTAAGRTSLGPDAPPWPVTAFTRVTGFDPGTSGFRVLATTPMGDPLLLDGPLGKGHVLLALAPGLPWKWGASGLRAALGDALPADARLRPGSPGWGSLALAAFDAGAVALPAWVTGKDLEPLLAAAPSGGDLGPALASAQAGQPLNGAVSVPFELAAGQSRSVTFAIGWHFPNVRRFEHEGNAYSRRWPDALAVAADLAAHAAELWSQTQLYHDTVYQSNLPEEFIDAMTSQSVILRGPTCFWAEDGYFGGFEGSYGCCPLNCTHVWNYAQTHARLFPEVARNQRVSDFVTYLKPDGETSHRQHGPHGAFIDGHCACISGAYREYQMSRDRAFLDQVWPGVKKATDWMIAAFDPDQDGVPAGQQANTYDCCVSGANTFVGSQYLAALAAAERLALAMGDSASAGRWQAVRQLGMANQNQRLWDGEYYIQVPGKPAANDYNNGCHSDQLLGQWWAHLLNLGYLYPADRVKGALEAVMKHNYRTNFVGFTQAPRRYVPDDEGGLLMCTWPRNDRPNPFIIYADEVWTGIEYAAAGAMVYEGLIDLARTIVATARSRYDGRLRPGLNSGPGGNPFNELECGKFYARAMSSWGLLIASQGLVLEGPLGVLGFKPRWQPQDHRSFFTAPEGWGLFRQEQAGSGQTDRIEVRWGQLRLRKLVFELPAAAGQATVRVAVDGNEVPATVTRDAREVTLALAAEAIAKAGSTVAVQAAW